MVRVHEPSSRFAALDLLFAAKYSAEQPANSYIWTLDLYIRVGALLYLLLCTRYGVQPEGVDDHGGRGAVSALSVTFQSLSVEDSLESLDTP